MVAVKPYSDHNVIMTNITTFYYLFYPPAYLEKIKGKARETNNLAEPEKLTYLLPKATTK